MSPCSRPRRARLFAAIIAALVLPATAAAGIRVRATDTTDYPNIRVTVVTSTDSAALPGLRENGQRVQGFSAGRLQGKTIVLAVDRSTSMAGQPLARATAAARAFVDQKPADDRIALVTFGQSALQLSSFSTATIDADGALRGLAVDSHQGTALYDAVVTASQAFAGQPTRARVLILLTDGRDVSSKATLQQAIAAARAARVAVYSIGIQGPQFTPGPLTELARSTGGSFYPSTTASLTAIYAQIAAELRRTWYLDYVTAARPGERVRLGIAATGNGSVTTEVVIPGGSSAAAPPGKSSWSGAVIAGLIAGVLLFLGVRFTMARSSRTRLRNRLEPYEGLDVASSRRRPEAGGWLGMLAPLFSLTERALAGRRLWRTLDRQLVRADLALRTVELAYLMFASGLVFAVAVSLGGVAPIVTLLFFALGALIPYLVISIKAERRLRAFERQLPDALNMLAASLTAGHGFMQAVQALVDTGGPPIDAEFRRVITDTRLGHPMDAALVAMGERMGSKDLDFVIRAVVIQRQVGGTLAGLFELVADTVARRQQFRQKIRSLTAMGRMSAIVLISLPIFVAGMISLTSPDYMAPLWHTHAGHVLLGLSVAMILTGALILKRLVAFKTT
jgi:tight adherence protein B